MSASEWFDGLDGIADMRSPSLIGGFSGARLGRRVWLKAENPVGIVWNTGSSTRGGARLCKNYL